MAVWTWTQNRWIKMPWHVQGAWPRPRTAVIWGSGESLHVTPRPRGVFNVVQNHAWRSVHPDLWVGMDDPNAWGAPDGTHNSAGEWPKVYRSNYSELPSGLPDGRKARDIPFSFFADPVKEGKRDDIFDFSKGIDQKFLWNQQGIHNTLHTTIQIVMWMGFKELVFAGVDLVEATKFAYPEVAAKLTPERIKNINQLLRDEFAWFQWFIPEAKKRGIVCRCLSPQSRLSKIMPMVDGGQPCPGKS